MTYRKAGSLALLAVLATTGTWAYSQDSEPSAETLRRAKAVGMKPEQRKGVTVYCWESADIGTRFKTKKCVNEDQLQEMIERLEAQKTEKMQH